MSILYTSFTEINYLIFIFFITFFFFFTSVTNFKLLLNSELFWISLYTIAVISSFFFDDIYILTLTLFFLMLSASEISIGLIFITNQMSLSNYLPIRFDL